jgi:hypothetical protein
LLLILLPLGVDLLHQAGVLKLPNVANKVDHTNFQDFVPADGGFPVVDLPMVFSANGDGQIVGSLLTHAGLAEAREPLYRMVRITVRPSAECARTGTDEAEIFLVAQDAFHNLNLL